MRELIRYLKNYKKESIIGPLFKMTEAIFELFVPLVMANIVDVGIKNQDMTYILWMCGLMVLLGILGLTCSITAQFFAAKAATGFGTELRNDLFAHINQLSYKELDEVGTATLVTRMTSDVNQTQTAVNLALRLFLRSPFIVAGAVIMAFTINVDLAWIFVVLVPVLSIVVFGVMGWSIPIYRKVQKKLDGVLLTTRENLDGVRVVRGFSKQNQEIEKFNEENGILRRLQLYVGKISALLNPMTYVIVNGATIVVLWFGGQKVSSGAITQGEVIALINYMTQILIALVAFANLIVSFLKGVACASRINEIFDVEPAKQDSEGVVPENTGDVSISFNKVSFAYSEGAEEVLSDITFQVKKGQTLGIIGGTGAGKSSLINLIPRFYDKKEGQIQLFGQDIEKYDITKLRTRIGLVPQKAVLFRGTIEENMRWGNEEATKEEIWEALEVAQAKEFVENKENKLQEKIRQGGTNLSGGQRQRLTIARALVKMPDVLILDDSASALDYATDAALRKSIQDHTKDMTTVIVSQRVSAVAEADKILVLDDGTLAGMGTNQELLDTCDVYKEICNSQLSLDEQKSMVKSGGASHE